ncbi:MAG TPA: hypothetical protein PLA97_05165 [Rubrivivax sp.]|nr:hypothetical protein [Rubrivivax sp.]
MLPFKGSPVYAVCLLVLAFGHVAAEPSDGATTDGQPGVVREAAATSSLERVTTPELHSGSRTVDMLIELQGKQAGLGVPATERAAPRADAPATRAEALARLAATPPASVEQTSLFGGGPVPVASPPHALPAGQRDPDWRAGATQNLQALPTPTLGSPGLKMAAAEGRSDDDGRISQMRAAMTWLRENREWVIGGSVLLLVVTGLASRRKAQRKR